MKRLKPDRFERTVADLATRTDHGVGISLDFHAVNLLRRHHAAVVRLVKQMGWANLQGEQWIHRKKLLATLAQWKRGTK